VRGDIEVGNASVNPSYARCCGSGTSTTSTLIVTFPIRVSPTCTLFVSRLGRYFSRRTILPSHSTRILSNLRAVPGPYTVSRFERDDLSNSTAEGLVGSDLRFAGHVNFDCRSTIEYYRDRRRRFEGFNGFGPAICFREIYVAVLGDAIRVSGGDDGRVSSKHCRMKHTSGAQLVQSTSVAKNFGDRGFSRPADMRRLELPTYDHLRRPTHGRIQCVPEFRHGGRWDRRPPMTRGC